MSLCVAFNRLFLPTATTSTTHRRVPPNADIIHSKVLEITNSQTFAWSGEKKSLENFPSKIWPKSLAETLKLSCALSRLHRVLLEKHLIKTLFALSKNSTKIFWVSFLRKNKTFFFFSMLTFLSFGKNWKFERENFPAFSVFCVAFQRSRERERREKSMENARMRQNNNKVGAREMAWVVEVFEREFYVSREWWKFLLWFDEFMTCSEIVFRVNWFVCCDEIVENLRLKVWRKEV